MLLSPCTHTQRHTETHRHTDTHTQRNIRTHAHTRAHTHVKSPPTEGHCHNNFSNPHPCVCLCLSLSASSFSPFLCLFFSLSLSYPLSSVSPPSLPVYLSPLPCLCSHSHLFSLSLSLSLSLSPLSSPEAPVSGRLPTSSSHLECLSPSTSIFSFTDQSHIIRRRKRFRAASGESSARSAGLAAPASQCQVELP